MNGGRRLSDRTRSLILEGAVVLVGTTVFVLVLMLPVVVHLGSTVFGSPAGDSSAAIASLWQMQHEGGFHLFGAIHHTLTGAPFGWNEDNGRNLQWLLPYYPAYLGTKAIGELAAFNVVILLGFVLSGVSMYALTRYLGCARLVSAWAAVAYIVFPRHLIHAQHGSLVHLEVFALLLLTLVALVRQPTWMRAALVAAATLACYFTAGYYGVMALVCVVAFALAGALTSARERRVWMLVAPSAAGAAASLIFAALSSLGGLNSGAGLHRTAGELSIFGIRPLELVIPPADSLLFGHRLDAYHESHLHGSTLTETTNYLGLLTITLALAWLVITWRRRKHLDRGSRLATAGLAGVCVAGLAFSTPSPLMLSGHALWMPSRILWEFVPALRVPSRWVMLVMSALIPLAALGLQEASRRITRRQQTERRFVTAPVALVCTAIVISFLELTISPTKPHFRAAVLPAQYSALQRTPPGILAEYPLISAYDYSFWQRRHRRRLLNGGPAGTEVDRVRRVLLDPRAAGTPEALARLGVTAIISDAGALDFTDGAPDLPDLRLGRGYKLIARLPDRSSVWQVVAKPAPAVLALDGGFEPPIVTTARTVGYPMTDQHTPAELEFIAPTRTVVRLAFRAVPRHGNRVVLRVGDPTRQRSFFVTGRTLVSVLVQVPSGRSRVFLSAAPATAGIVLFDLRAERATGAPELNAAPLPESGNLRFAHNGSMLPRVPA
jgi:hypothetical protein